MDVTAAALLTEFLNYAPCPPVWDPCVFWDILPSTLLSTEVTHIQQRCGVPDHETCTAMAVGGVTSRGHSQVVVTLVVALVIVLAIFVALVVLMILHKKKKIDLSPIQKHFEGIKCTFCVDCLSKQWNRSADVPTKPSLWDKISHCDIYYTSTTPGNVYTQDMRPANVDYATPYSKCATADLPIYEEITESTNDASHTERRQPLGQGVVSAKYDLTPMVPVPSDTLTPSRFSVVRAKITRRKLFHPSPTDHPDNVATNDPITRFKNLIRNRNQSASLNISNESQHSRMKIKLDSCRLRCRSDETNTVSRKKSVKNLPPFTEYTSNGNGDCENRLTEVKIAPVQSFKLSKNSLRFSGCKSSFDNDNSLMDLKNAPVGDLKSCKKFKFAGYKSGCDTDNGLMELKNTSANADFKSSDTNTSNSKCNSPFRELKSMKLLEVKADVRVNRSTRFKTVVTRLMKKTTDDRSLRLKQLRKSNSRNQIDTSSWVCNGNVYSHWMVD